MMRVLWCVGLLLFACNSVYTKYTKSDKLQCKDESNSPVDWYVLYKLPKISESSNPLIRNGLAYLYITSETVDMGWQLSKRGISESKSIPGNTLAPIYNNANKNSTLWVFYNDSPPNTQTSGKYGHSKGVVASNKDKGYWLIHSVPNFPPDPDSGEKLRKRNTDDSENDGSLTDEAYSYPASGQIYGQSFLCISFGQDQFDILARQLMYNQIIVYNRNIPGKLAEQYPVLKDAINQVRIKQAPYNNKALLKSLGSVEFVSFAKSDKWEKDLYDEFVAPQLQSDMLVETWLNGRGRLPTDCVGAKVYNIESLALKAANVDFKSSRDHSKWAVTVQNNTNRTWVCVGDINRADTQYSRGGGTVCFNMNKVWNNYRNSVNDVEPCPRRH